MYKAEQMAELQAEKDALEAQRKQSEAMMAQLLEMKQQMAAVLFLQIGSVSATEVDTDGDIIYTDGVDKFVFITESDYSFDNFKTVMPGDSIEQRILLRNDIYNDRKIKVYMRALGASEGSEDFLSQLNLTIVKDTDAILFDATAEKAAQLTDWVYLGTLYSGGECELVVTLDVPVTMGNEYANAVGYLDWEFGVSVYPVEDSDPKPPQTGDDAQLWLWIGMAAVSLLVLLLLVLVWKKDNKKKR